MTTPILLAVDDQPGALDVIRRELTGRYATDYQIICENSPISALRRLAALRRAQQDAAVLILFAASDMTAMTGIEFLQRAH